VKILADQVSKSKYFVCFTGAGISTSVGIPDYRSTKSTILTTGAGDWEISDEDRKKRLPSIRKQV
jgi:NAD-dependent SIR2 family protein deacetylase